MIKDALKAIENALQPNEAIKYINEDWGQLDYYQQPPVLFPCVLLECEEVDYTTQTGKHQQAIGVISVRVADYRVIQQSNVRANNTGGDRYGYFELLSQIHAVLQGLSGVTFTALDRRNMRRVRRDDAIREMILSYRFTFRDSTAATPLQRLPVPAKVVPQIKKQ